MMAAVRRAMTMWFVRQSAIFAHLSGRDHLNVKVCQPLEHGRDQE
jgi:hypothetical protein